MAENATPETAPAESPNPASRAELEVRPELFFGFVAPVGADLDKAHDALVKELRDVGYESENLKLSSFLKQLKPFEKLGRVANDLEHIERHMDAGDELRRATQRDDAMVGLAIAQVQKRRGDTPRPSVAYVFRSLKHRQEIAAMRRIYGPFFFLISIFDSETGRRDRLETRLERHNLGGVDTAASKLMKRDEKGTEEDPHGQDVHNAFPMADCFVDGRRNIEAQIRRFVRIVFQDHEQSPTRHEFAMAMALVAARRSADLSRQIGAAIVDKDGEVLVVGCNEVPKPQGGVYWDGDEPDGRDLALGKDPNAVMSDALLHELFERLRVGGFLAVEDGQTVADLVRAAKGDVLGGARVRSLIEFGRVVHAEMNAIAHAARRGIGIAGASLYTTTYPCHGCARHILAAGIAEVFYIEPYPKSLAQKLYPKAICDEPSGDEKRLVFNHFVGVAPGRYAELFSFGKRKDRDGFALRFDGAKAKPRVQNPGPGYVSLERQFVDVLFEKLKELDWL